MYYVIKNMKVRNVLVYSKHWDIFSNHPLFTYHSTEIVPLNWEKNLIWDRTIHSYSDDGSKKLTAVNWASFALVEISNPSHAALLSAAWLETLISINANEAQLNAVRELLTHERAQTILPPNILPKLIIVVDLFTIFNILW